ncbi:hypothetical protein RFI_21163 [Reticulomyxa filosa]|uniref:Uncharacterized protein n=1 Tax=Reticulomyxa filosa TaxID=46433 RepID=X6MQQ2_RETFI|nr:hypothetical protein RFI_21163 [Reticulomyxa filosa]|eukprot:ETO16194.1 hypothetical protein RFI_21163 [Reticulomyxa filosa]
MTKEVGLYLFAVISCFRNGAMHLELRWTMMTYCNTKRLGDPTDFKPFLTSCLSLLLSNFTFFFFFFFWAGFCFLFVCFLFYHCFAFAFSQLFLVSFFFLRYQLFREKNTNCFLKIKKNKKQDKVNNYNKKYCLDWID